MGNESPRPPHHSSPITHHSVFDAIVIGVGAMGSAALYHLARRGQRVLGLERFDVPHDLGSSHGITRIIRLAYAEHPCYVPLLRRAYEWWREMEQTAGERLMVTTGGLDIGRLDSAIVQGSLRSCVEHGIAHEVLSEHVELLRFELSQKEFAMQGRELVIPVARSGICYGVAQWIRLDLDETTQYSNRPVTGGQNTHWPNIVYRFPQPISVSAGDAVRIMARHDRAEINVDLIGRA